MAEEAKDKHGEAEGGGGGHGGGGHGGGGHGGGGHEEAHEGAPEWLISFADNVALIMGFFVILLAMNMAKKTAGGIGGMEKYPSEEPTTAMVDFVIEIRKAFNTPIDADGTDPREEIFRKRLRERAKGGDSTLPGPDGDKHDLQAPRPSTFVNVTGSVTFQDGSTEVTADAMVTLDQVARSVRGQRWMIEVRGHVSANEARRDKEKAMRLGYERALSAAKAISAAGVEWERIRLVSCGDNERVVPLAHDRDSHRNNQRVEIVVTQEMMAGDPYSQGREFRGSGADDPGPVGREPASSSAEHH